jgi:hypothetical protein
MFTIPIITTIPEMKDEAGLWTQVQELGSSFDSWMGEKPNGTEMLFLFSTRPTIYYEHFFGTKPYNPGWQIIRDRISYHNKIYDSDGIQLFSVLWK